MTNLDRKAAHTATTIVAVVTAMIVTAYTTFREFARVTEPATHADVAKAILWAFIAGFSEGLVPNVIDRIVKRALSEEGAPTVIDGAAG